MAEAKLDEIFGVKVPVSDLPMSRAWYERVLGFKVEMEFPDDDGVVRGVAGSLPGVSDAFFALRENPKAATGMQGSDFFNLAVTDEAAIDAWGTHLDSLEIPHSPKIDATVGWLMVFHDPDGIELHLYSRTLHGIDQSGRSGYGRKVD